MDYPLLEPAAVFEHFWRICAIPHCSGNEAALAALIAYRAEEASIETVYLEGGNLLLRRGASPGHEGRPGLILQAHLDMVGQADKESRHNFATDPIRPRLNPADPAWLVATGTSLGADNGIGVAAALAFLEAEDGAHGPLEVLLTTREEEGCIGAQALRPGLLKGSFLLNLDAEDELEICVGCAGGSRIFAAAELGSEPAPGLLWFEARVGGLAGGHSASDIALGRANAIDLLAGLLVEAGQGLAWRLSRFDGAGLPNAIPREAAALVGIEAGRAEAWTAAFEKGAAAARARFAAAELGLVSSLRRLAPAEEPAEALDAGRSAALLGTVLALPRGVIAMDAELPGLVQSSCNTGSLVIKTGAGARLDAVCLPRSSVDEEKLALLARIAGLWKEVGVATRIPSLMPAWRESPTSPFVGLVAEAYRRVAGAEPRVTASHGGLECAILSRSYPDLAMVAVGPTITNPHSPAEALKIDTVGRLYRLIAEVAARLA